VEDFLKHFKLKYITLIWYAQTTIILPVFNH